MIWTLVPIGVDVQCGRCSRILAAGKPVALVTPAKLRRCESCAEAPVDRAQIAAVRAALEQRHLAPAVPVRVPHRPSGFVKAADSVGSLFDPKARRLGPRDD